MVKQVLSILRQLSKVAEIFLGGSVVAVHLSKQHFLDATLDNSIERKSGHRDSNPGLLGEKRECYLCAMPPPFPPSYIGKK